MAGFAHVEIERKFLLASDGWRGEVVGRAPIEQIYLASTPMCQVRLRRYGADAFVTVKGRAAGGTRTEIETAVPVGFVDAVLAAGFHPVPPILKTRHLVPAGEFTFEVDEYGGANTGLVVAEIELPERDAVFPRPSWLGVEVTGDARYRNLYLAQRPYTTW
jgi:adenylate cyclase